MIYSTKPLDKSNLRKARLAAIVLFHICDYAKESKFSPYIDVMKEAKYGETLGMVLGGRIGFMHELIRLSANASKHYQLSNKKHYIQSVDQIKNDDAPGLFSGPFGEGNFSEVNHVSIKLTFPPSVEIKELTNNLIDISIVFDEVMTWWEDAIYS